jgi:hypothetical protein
LTPYDKQHNAAGLDGDPGRVFQTSMKFPSQVRNKEVIAAGHGINDYAMLCHKYGRGRWRKMKGEALVRTSHGSRWAEIHWYECNGIGKVRVKIKRFL